MVGRTLESAIELEARNRDGMVDVEVEENAMLQVIREIPGGLRHGCDVVHDGQGVGIPSQQVLGAGLDPMPA